MLNPTPPPCNLNPQNSSRQGVSQKPSISTHHHTTSPSQASLRPTPTPGHIDKLLQNLIDAPALASTGHNGQNEHDRDEDDADSDQPPEHRPAGAEVRPAALALPDVLLELVAAEFVVDEAGEGDGVAEGLQGADGVAEDEHAGDDEQDVLEHARQRHD